MQVTYHDMGAHISPYDRGFQVWSQHLPGVSEQGKVMVAQLQVMSQGSLVSYLDSFYIFALGIIFICWLPFLMKRPKVGAPVHLD